MPKKEEERRLKNTRDKAKRDRARDARISKEKNKEKKESWVAKLKKNVQKHFKDKKKKENGSGRAEVNKKQLKENLSPEDIKRLRGEK